MQQPGASSAVILSREDQSQQAALRAMPLVGLFEVECVGPTLWSVALLSAKVDCQHTKLCVSAEISSWTTSKLDT